eukprot:scpid14380/ scgid5989/ DENN domain-containing protein 5B; Rab6IP1-like protein
MDVDVKHLVRFFAVCAVGDELKSYLTEDNERAPLERAYSPDVICHFPKERSEHKFNKDASRLSLPHGVRFYTRETVPQTPTFHPFVITDELGARSYCVSLLFYQQAQDPDIIEKFAKLQDEFLSAHPDHAGKVTWKRGDTLMQAKTLLLVLSGPYSMFGRHILEQMLACGHAEDGSDLVAQHLHCLLHSVFLPKPGCMVEYPGPFGRAFCRLPLEKSMPAVDFSLRRLLQKFSVNDILLILKCLLLESYFLIVSKDLHEIGMFTYVLPLLIFPFYWDHAYIPVLPMVDDPAVFFDAPCPFIMGFKIDCKSPARDDLPFEIREEVCLINIDFGHVDIEVHKNLPLPKAALLMANLKEKLETHDIQSPLLGPRTPDSRPSTTSGLSSVCESADLFQRDMAVCCNLDKPSPKVKVHHRHVLRRQISPTSSPTAQLRSTPTKSSSPGGAPQSKAKARLARIALEAGIPTSFSDSARVDELQNTGGVQAEPEDAERSQSSNDPYVKELQRKWAIEEDGFGEMQKFNSEIQQVFLDYYVSLLHDYSLYICESQSDFVIFDKESFLSDQPASLLGFFEIFLETALFNKLIESKFGEKLGTVSPSLEYFEECVRKATSRSDVQQVPSGEKSRRRGKSHAFRFEVFQQQAQPERPQSSSNDLLSGDERSMSRHSSELTSPVEDGKTLDMPSSGHNNSLGIPNVNGDGSSPTSSGIGQLRLQASVTPEPGTGPSNGSGARTPDTGNLLLGLLPTISTNSLPSTATSQATFVRQLLRDCRVKVKRLLVSKMGRDAMMLGHADHAGGLLEDNSLITSLCELLERVWMHGSVQGKHASSTQGKSVMWTHLETYYEERRDLLEEVCMPADDELFPGSKHRASVNDGVAAESNSLLSNDGSSPHHSPSMSSDKSVSSSSSSSMSRSISSPSISDLASNVKLFANNLRRERRSLGRLHELPIMDQHVGAHVRLLRARYCSSAPTQPAVGLLDDIRSVKEMAAIKTDIGFARAFVRLSLEKKVLSSHIAELVQDRMMLQSSYREYAFLRCEDELEQFLIHLLSLTTVDVFCFSTRYSQTVFRYSLVLLPCATGIRQQTTSGTCQLFGSHGISEVIQLPEQSGSVSVEITNLGILESMILRCPGLCITSRYSRMFVVCSVTDACYEFVVDSWVRAEDNNQELLLVATQVSPNTVLEASLPSRRVSGGSPPTSVDSTGGARLRENVASCVNNFAKYLDKALPPSQTLTGLIWGPDGLCHHLQEVFTHGLKPSRVLRSRRPAWEFIEKLCANESDVPATLASVFAALDRKTTVSKSVKFYEFVCHGLRTKELPIWVSFIFKSSLRMKMYQQWALLWDGELTFHILAVIAWLCELEFQLPTSISMFLTSVR